MLAPVANKAAEIGPDTFDWWRDWRGKTCAIIASGPSAKSAAIGSLRGMMPIIAIKENIELCPWADVVYGCDLHWWVHRRGLPDFKGLKLAYDDAVMTRFRDVKKIAIKDKTRDEILTDVPASVGSGGNSGFQAFNLAIQFGANRIILIGYDMTDRPGVHWYGRNGWPRANNPSESNFRRWRKAFEDAAETCRRLGVEVVNASPVSVMRGFPRWSIEDTLRAWGLSR